MVRLSEFDAETATGLEEIDGEEAVEVKLDSKTKPKPKRKRRKVDRASASPESELATNRESSEWSRLGVVDSLAIALIEKLKFLKPTDIQALSLKASILKDASRLVGRSATGSGKTLAFVLPVLQNAMKCGSPFAYAMIVAPTRELAKQTADLIEALGFEAGLLVGGMSIEKQRRVLEQKQPSVLVGTPGRISYFLEELPAPKMLVMDEADRLLVSSGKQRFHFKELESIVSKASRSVDKLYVFSATITETPNLPELKMAPNAKGVTIINDSTTKIALPKDLRLAVAVCPDDDAFATLYAFLLKYPARSLVFCNTISQTKRLASALRLLFPEDAVKALHAHQQQRQRLKHLDKFVQATNSKRTVLVATDVAARGLDLSSKKIDFVVQMGSPTNVDLFVHRAGRTARASRGIGLSLSIVGGSEARRFEKISKRVEDQTEFVFTYIPKPSQEASFARIKKRCNLAEKIARKTISSSKKKADDAWLEKARADVGGEGITSAPSRVDAELVKMRKSLDAMLEERVSKAKGITVVSTSEVHGDAAIDWAADLALV